MEDGEQHAGDADADAGLDEQDSQLLALDRVRRQHGVVEEVAAEDDPGDAGDGYGYRDGEYLLTTYEAVGNGDDVEVRIVSRQGEYESAFDTLEIELL